jgi:predicted nucleic acid-binding protein
MDADAVLVDTNVLLEATAPARDLHRAGRGVFDEWPNRGVRLCLSGQVLREYLVVATRGAEVNGLGLGIGAALDNVAAFLDRCRFLPEDGAVARHLRELLRNFPCTGKRIHDANLVATGLVHGVTKLVTANAKDFEPFDSLVEVMPLGESLPDDDAPGA